MKQFCKLTAALLSAALCLTSYLPLQSIRAADTGRTVSFTESTETINNPGMGYTSTLWYRCKPGNTPVHSPTGSLVLMFIDIGAFSSGENGTADADGNYIPGKDYPLDEAFFDGLRGTFENCRRNGCTIALRFRYDDDGTQNPEPATFDLLKSHIRQIQENRLLEDYQDILMYVESGFVGCYGEQWGGKYCSLEQKAELLDLMLEVVPAPIPVTVRTPNIFATWAGIKQAEMDKYISEPDSTAARVGLYDDGYMGSDSDLGTYANREVETTWLGNQTLTSYFGGEFSGNLEYAQKFETYLPQNAVPEMYKTHLSYINSNIFGLYQDYTFGAEYDVQAGDHSAYYGENVRKFIRDHLGYRFVLRDVSIPEKAEQGAQIPVTFRVENTGFANPIREQQAEILLEQDGCFYRAPLSLDSRQWRSCTETEEQFTVHLPGSVQTGDWNIYLKLSVGDHSKDTYAQLAQRSVRFANDGVWNSAIGANYLGTVSITQSKSPAAQIQHDLYTDDNPGSGTLFSIQDVQITDGAVSSPAEVSEELLRAEKESAKLYITSDDNNLYVRALYGEDGSAPVWNLQFTNKLNDTYYWIYYASNGYIYFNHGEPTGCLQKHSKGCVEFQIPLGDVMGLENGAELSNVRFFLQDSGNDWLLMEDIRCESYTLSGGFPVYNACNPVKLCEGETYSMTVCTDLEDAQYQWLCGGKEITGANAATYRITDAGENAAGIYSVRITSASGSVRAVDVTEVLEVIRQDVPGDVNADGLCSRQDVLTLQNWLLTKTANLPNPAAADLDRDGILTARDLSLLKALLLP